MGEPISSIRSHIRHGQDGAPCVEVSTLRARVWAAWALTYDAAYAQYNKRQQLHQGDQSWWVMIPVMPH